MDVNNISKGLPPPGGQEIMGYAVSCFTDTNIWMVILSAIMAVHLHLSEGYLDYPPLAVGTTWVISFYVSQSYYRC